MTGRRRRIYLETMRQADSELVIRAGLQFRRALLAGKQDLKPFNEQYRVLDDAMQSVDRTLESVSGKQIDHRAQDFGLLAAAAGPIKPWRPS